MTNPVQQIMNTIEGWNTTEKVLTFDGGTLNGVGDISGTNNPATIFTVTGEVAIKLLAVCTTDLVGATATVEVGTALSTAALIAQTTATDIDANEIWHDATPDASVELFSVLAENIVAQDVELLGATADITAGVIKFICLWKPLSADASVTPSTL